MILNPEAIPEACKNATKIIAEMINEGILTEKHLKEIEEMEDFED